MVLLWKELWSKSWINSLFLCLFMFLYIHTHVYECIQEWIYTQIKITHRTCSLCPHLYQKLTEKMCALLPLFTAKDFSFKVLITLCTTKYEIRITGINMQNFWKKRQNHRELISTHFLLYVSRMSGLICNLLHCLK